MDRSELYSKMADRKFKPADMEPYSAGTNGRVDRCVDLMKAGKIRVGGRLVDFGCGIGDLGYACRELFDTRYAIDISTTNLMAAEKKGNIIHRHDVDRDGSLPVEDGSMDTVTALDFIEHIIDPESFARECFRLLSPGGHVFINTPNIRFWPHVEELLYNGTFPHTSGDREVFHGGHLAFFTYKDLCSIFAGAGFIRPEMFMDDEGYRSPPTRLMTEMRPVTQAAYQQLAMELGCPNLLFRMIKP